MPDNYVDSERFDVPKSPKKSIYQITRFLGCDFTNSPSAVDEYHSPNCVNFIRMMPGKIRKRMGYYPITEGTGKVYAIWKWDDDNYIVHVGKHMYHIGRNLTGDLDFSVIKTNVDTSYSEVLKNSSDVIIEVPQKKLAYIRSGNEAMIFGSGSIFFYDGADVLYTVDDYSMYIPTVTIQKAPDGGGISYDPFNLLCPYFEETFYVASDYASETVFHMSYKDLEEVTEVGVMDENGDFQILTETTDYTVDTEEGTITFVSAPGQSPIEGEDNVYIIAKKTFDGYYNRIANCSFAIAYGINGNYDRVFISGNPDYPNFDWYSEKDEITYFPDTGYSVLGSDASPINGYAVVSNELVTLKGNGTDRQAAIIRQGDFDSDGNPVFRVVRSLQGYPMLAPDTSVMAGVEPMFLTEEGIMAVTESDLSGNHMMNSRSYYLNGKLLKEKDLDKAFAIRHGDFYMLFINSHVYILDVLQSITSENTPYSTRQYATFYWENIPASCAASIDGTVYFGTADGEIMAFYTDTEDIESYTDNGTAIKCTYETADIDAVIFFKNKTYRYIAVRVFPSVVSSMSLWALKDGVWDFIKLDDTTIRYFSFSNLRFSAFTFKTDSGTQLVTSKLRIKKSDHIRFKMENDGNYEPLMIDQLGIEYTQYGNYKN